MNCLHSNSHQMPSFIFSEKKKRKTPRNVFVISALRVKPFLIYCTATAHKRMNVKEIAFLLLWSSLTIVPAKIDFIAETQNFIEYFYPLNFNLSADFQKINAKIPCTPSYLGLCIIALSWAVIDPDKTCRCLHMYWHMLQGHFTLQALKLSMLDFSLSL